LKASVVNLFRNPYDVYIGSPRDGRDPREIQPGAPGFLGNPFTTGTPEENLEDFRRYFRRRLQSDRQFRLAVAAIRGRRLGCVCLEDEPHCHGHVISDWLEGRRSLTISG
jgi:hypothetical protein